MVIFMFHVYPVVSRSVTQRTTEITTESSIGALALTSLRTSDESPSPKTTEEVLGQSSISRNPTSDLETGGQTSEVTVGKTTLKVTDLETGGQISEVTAVDEKSATAHQSSGLDAMVVPLCAVGGSFVLLASICGITLCIRKYRHRGKIKRILEY